MDHAINRLRFGKYLEITGPGGKERALLLGINGHEYDLLIKDFAGQFSVMTPLSTIVDVLGTPDIHYKSAALYDLHIRTAYIFEFRLSTAKEVVVDFAYVRKLPIKVELRIPTSSTEAAALRAELARLGATGAELLEAFGEPEDRMGWGSYETWRYPWAPTLELRLGVVEDVSRLISPS